MTSQYRHRRTSAQVFPNPIEPGEIAVNTANRQIAVGDAASGAPLMLVAIRYFDVRAQYAVSEFVVEAGVIYRANVAVLPGAFNSAHWDAIAGTVDSRYLLRTGDTMTGPLVLDADPADPLGAVTKQYVDAITDPVGPALGTKVARAGDTMTGPLQLSGDPTALLEASTKRYVDAAASAAGSALGTKVARAGDTMTGPLQLSGDPTAPLQAATMQYVDQRMLVSMLVSGGQNITGGFSFTTYVQSSGNFTPNPLNGNYQTINNVGAFTITAPGVDCAIDLLVRNGAAAGAIGFSGFTTGITGDALTSANGSNFIISIRRMAGVSTYTVKALQ